MDRALDPAVRSCCAARSRCSSASPPSHKLRDLARVPRRARRLPLAAGARWCRRAALALAASSSASRLRAVRCRAARRARGARRGGAARALRASRSRSTSRAAGATSTAAAAVRRRASRSRLAASRATRCWSRAALVAALPRRRAPLVWVDAVTVAGGVGVARGALTRRAIGLLRERAPALRALRRCRDERGAARLERAALDRGRRARGGGGGAGAADRRAPRARRAGRRAGEAARAARSARRRRVARRRRTRGRRARSAAPAPDGREHAALLRLADLPGLQDAAAALRVARARRERRGCACVLASDGPRAEHAAFVRARAARRVRATCCRRARLAYQVGKLPYAVLIDARGRRAREGSRQHARAPREPVRGEDARRRVDPGYLATRARARAASPMAERERSIGWLERGARAARAPQLAARLPRAARRRCSSAARRCRCCRRARARRERARRAPDDARSQRRRPAIPTSCDYWRHCAIDGFLCSCCGGTQTRVPARHRDVAGHLDRHLPQSRRRQGLRHLVQRLLRQAASAAAASATATRATSRLLTPQSNDINWCFGHRRAAATTARRRSCSASPTEK